VKIELTQGDLLDLTEALNLRISHSRDVLEQAELDGKLDGRDEFKAKRLAHIARLEALRFRLVSEWSLRP
jgi:hypothetical protein